MDIEQSLPVRLEELLEVRPWVRGLARSLVADPAAADDLEQDAWVTALEHPPAHRSSLRGWFASVLRSRLRDRRRSSSSRERRERTVSRDETSVPSASDLAARAEAHAMLVEAILRLQPEDRDLVLERWFEGRSAADIARRRGLNPSTVRTRLSRAHERLRSELTGHDGGQDGHWRTALLLLGGGKPVAAPAPPLSGTLLGAGGLLFLTSCGVLAAFAALTLFPRPGGGDGDGGADESGASRLVAALVPDDGPPPRPPAPAPSVPAPVVAEETPSEAPAAPQVPPSPLRARVTVVDEAGAPVEGASVTALLFSGGKSDSWEIDPAASPVVTGEDGLAELSFHVGGRVRLLAREGDRAAITGPRDIEAGVVSTGTLTLRAARSLSGLVLGEGGRAVAGARVQVLFHGDDLIVTRFETVTDEGGTFRLEALPASLFADEVGLGVEADGYVAKWQWTEPGEPVAAHRVVTLLPSVTVTGRCVNEAGDPVPHVIINSGGLGSSRDSDADGRFAVSGLPSASGSLLFEPEGYVARRVEIPGGADRTCDLGDVVLEAGRPLRGIVVDVDGAPVENASINLESIDADQFVGYGGTGEDGRFTIEHVGGGDHTVHVYADGRPEDGGFSLRGVLEGARTDGAGEVRIVVHSGLTLRIDLEDAATNLPVKATRIDVRITRESDGTESGHGTFSDDGTSTSQVSFEAAGTHAVKVTVPGYEPFEAAGVMADPRRGVVLRARLVKKP